MGFTKKREGIAFSFFVYLFFTTLSFAEDHASFCSDTCETIDSKTLNSIQQAAAASEAKKCSELLVDEKRRKRLEAFGKEVPIIAPGSYDFNEFKPRFNYLFEENSKEKIDDYCYCKKLFSEKQCSTQNYDEVRGKIFEILSPALVSEMMKEVLQNSLYAKKDCALDDIAKVCRANPAINAKITEGLINLASMSTNEIEDILKESGSDRSGNSSFLKSRGNGVGDVFDFLKEFEAKVSNNDGIDTELIRDNHKQVMTLIIHLRSEVQGILPEAYPIQDFKSLLELLLRTKVKGGFYSVSESKKVNKSIDELITDYVNNSDNPDSDFNKKYAGSRGLEILRFLASNTPIKDALKKQEIFNQLKDPNIKDKEILHQIYPGRAGGYCKRLNTLKALCQSDADNSLIQGLVTLLKNGDLMEEGTFSSHAVKKFATIYRSTYDITHKEGLAGALFPYMCMESLPLEECDICYLFSEPSTWGTRSLNGNISAPGSWPKLQEDGSPSPSVVAPRKPEVGPSPPQAPSASSPDISRRSPRPSREPLPRSRSNSRQRIGRRVLGGGLSVYIPRIVRGDKGRKAANDLRRIYNRNVGLENQNISIPTNISQAQQSIINTTAQIMQRKRSELLDEIETLEQDLASGKISSPEELDRRMASIEAFQKSLNQLDTDLSKLKVESGSFAQANSQTNKVNQGTSRAQAPNAISSATGGSGQSSGTSSGVTSQAGGPSTLKARSTGLAPEIVQRPLSAIVSPQIYKDSQQAIINSSRNGEVVGVMVNDSTIRLYTVQQGKNDQSELKDEGDFSLKVAMRHYYIPLDRLKLAANYKAVEINGESKLELPTNEDKAKALAYKDVDEQRSQSRSPASVAPASDDTLNRLETILNNFHLNRLRQLDLLVDGIKPQ